MLNRCLCKAIFKRSYNKAEENLHRYLRIWGLEQKHLNHHLKQIQSLPRTLTTKLTSLLLKKKPGWLPLQNNFISSNHDLIPFQWCFLISNFV